MSLPRVPLDSSNERQHRTVIATATNELIKVRPPHDQTSAEAAEQIVPIDPRYAPGDIRRYGAVCDGTTNDANAIQKAANVSDTHEMVISGSALCNSAITFPTGGHVRIRGINNPLLRTDVAGQRLFQCADAISFWLDGVRFEGDGSATDPTGTFEGYAATSTGLVTVTDATDVRITNCEATAFYNGFVTYNCDRVWICENRISAWLTYGILAGFSTDFTIDHNVIVGCDQAGAANAYGIMATGDEAGGSTQRACSISFNTIRDVPSWDGIMSHDVSGLRVVGNDIRNVRMGVDVGHFEEGNIVDDIVVSDNVIVGTTTDTWAGAGANSGGILLTGFDATHRVRNATVTGNIVKGFFAITGAAYSGDFSNIVIRDCSRATITGNVVSGVGNIVSNAGIYATGTVDQLTVAGNTLQGAMGAAGIRLAALTGGQISITGNATNQTTTSDPGIQVSGSTITSLAVEGNSTNSTSPFAIGTSTVTYSGFYLSGSTTWNPGSLADGAGESTTVTVTGAVLGDFAIASFSNDVQNITLSAYVSSDNTVAVRLQNESGGTLDLASGTVRARVFRA
jgi:hypothetical protein